MNALVEQCAFEVIAGEIQKRHAHAGRSFLKCCQRAEESLSSAKAHNRRGVHPSRREPAHEQLSKLRRRGQARLRLTGKEFSGLGKLTSPLRSSSFETKLRFEILDLATQGRLGDVKSPRGLGHVAKLGDGCKISQVTKFHTT